MSKDRLVGAAVFVAIVAVFFILGTVAGFRVAGVATLISGLVIVRRGELPVGIEGEPPSLYLRGSWATVGGIAIAVVGLAVVWFAPEAVCYFSKGQECTP